MIATGPNMGLRKCAGSGMIKFACEVSPLRDSGLVSPCAWVRSLKVTDAPVDPGNPMSVLDYGKGIACLVLPGLEVHVSLGPMTSRIRKTSRLVTC